MTADFDFCELLVTPEGYLEVCEPTGKENGLIKLTPVETVELVDRATARRYWDHEQVLRQAKQTARAWWRR